MIFILVVAAGLIITNVRNNIAFADAEGVRVEPTMEDTKSLDEMVSDSTGSSSEAKDVQAVLSAKNTAVISGALMEF